MVECSLSPGRGLSPVTSRGGGEGYTAWKGSLIISCGSSLLYIQSSVGWSLLTPEGPHWLGWGVWWVMKCCRDSLTLEIQFPHREGAFITNSLVQGTSLWAASQDGRGSVGVTARTSSHSSGSSAWMYYSGGGGALKGYSHSGRGGWGGRRVLDEDVVLTPRDSMSRVGSRHS